ncbi:MAG: DUF4349 domain-containing protein [Alphaproteobacteria bacterium]|nr:DUF4349 domain-containing protein [Alphaproteobacteria bacterium]
MLALLLLFVTTALAGEAHIQASLVLKVAQPEATRDALIAQAEGAGGWFAGLGPDHVSLRVPPDALPALIDFAEAQGLVADRGYSSVDLTADLVTLRARLESREAMLEQYFALLPEASPQSVVTVEREVVRVVSDIEALKGQLRVLEHRATWAELDVSFRFRDRRAPIRDGTSGFAWLNTLNQSDVIDDFRKDRVTWRGPALRGQAPTPDGFSPYKQKREHRAVSADGVLYRVRYARHEPEAEPAFWMEAARERMLAAGYTLIRETETTLGGQPGFVLELTAPYGVEDYSYLIAVAPAGRKLLIIEVVGEVSRVEARRNEVLAAVAATAP